MVVSVAIALAGLTWRIAGHASTGAVTVPSGARSLAAPADVTAALAFAPFGKGAIGDASQATALPLKLKGVFAASPADLSVAYIEVGGDPAKAFRIGEAPGGGTIEGILRDRVLLRVNGRIEYLAFPDPTLSSDQQAAAAAPVRAAPAAAPAPAAAAAAPAPSSVSAARKHAVRATAVGFLTLSKEIHVGAKVAKGALVATVEVLGIPSEVRATHGGIVAALKSATGDPVEYGQEIFLLESIGEGSK